MGVKALRKDNWPNFQSAWMGIWAESVNNQIGNAKNSICILLDDLFDFTPETCIQEIRVLIMVDKESQKNFQHARCIQKNLDSS